MKISIVAAMGHNRVIGADNQMPWHLPADLKHFKAVTMGKPVVMGRKTYESIGRPLPGRRNIIVSRQQDLVVPGCDVVASFDAVLDLLHEQPEIMVIGGGAIYTAALPRASRMYLTFIDTDVEGDTFFPAWDSDQWEIVDRDDHHADGKNAFAYSFIILDRAEVDVH